MFKQTLALCFAFMSLAGAAEIESVTDPSHCDRIPAEYRDSCASSTMAGHPFTFKVLASTPNSLLIEPLDQKKVEEVRRLKLAEDLDDKETARATRRATDKSADALESIAESSKQTSYAVTVIAAVNVVAVAVGIISILALK